MRCAVFFSSTAIIYLGFLIFRLVTEMADLVRTLRFFRLQQNGYENISPKSLKRRRKNHVVQHANLIQYFQTYRSKGMAVATRVCLKFLYA